MIAHLMRGALEASFSSKRSMNQKKSEKAKIIDELFGKTKIKIGKIRQNIFLCETKEMIL